METKAVYGRSALIEQIATTQSHASVLIGDSGVGKSTVLAALRDQPSLGSANDPYTPYLTEPLPQATLRALAVLFRQLSGERGTAREIESAILEESKRLRQSLRSDVPERVAAFLLSVALGERAKPLIRVGRRLCTVFKRGGAGGAAAKVEELREQLPVEVLAGFLDQASAFAPSGRAAILVDTGELSEADARLLADLGAAVGNPTRLVTTHAIVSPASNSVVDQLRRFPSVSIHEVGGLDEGAIASWLADAGADPGLAEAVARLSEGNALLAGDLILHAAQSGDLSDVPVDEVFAALTRLTWFGLADEAQVAARRLAVLEQDLPTAQLLPFIAMDAARWGRAREELVRARIFVQRSDGSVGFHERRRRFIVESLLADFERPQLARDAAEAVWPLIAAGNDDWLAQYASLVRASADDQLGANLIDAVDSKAFAILAALVELTDTNEEMALRQLLDYVQLSWHAGFGLTEALGALADTGLIRPSLVEGQSLAEPDIRFKEPLLSLGSLTDRQLAVVRGEAALRFGRPPIRSLARRVFEELIAPALAAGSNTTFGLGARDVAEIAAAARAATGADRDQQPPGLLATINWRGASISVTASFPDSRLRDEAIERLRAPMPPLFGTPAVVQLVRQHPVECVQLRRWTRAAERASGLAPGEREGWGRERLPIVANDAAAIELRLRTRQAIRHLCGDDAICWNLESEEALHWAKLGPGNLITVYVATDRPAVIEHEPFHYNWVSAVYVQQLRELLELDRSERVKSVKSWYEASVTVDPIFTEIHDLWMDAEPFNDEQPRRRLLASEEALAQAIIEAEQQLLSDASALMAELPELRSAASPVIPYEYRLIVALPPRSQRDWTNTVSAELHARVSRSGEPAATVHLVKGVPAGQSSPDRVLHVVPTGTFEQVFGEKPTFTNRALPILSECVLHRPEDVDLVLDQS
jgi:hypothetical protein